MRKRFVALWFIAAMAGAQAAPEAPPFEVTKDHVNVEVSADGSYVESREEAYRILDTRGIDLLHEHRLEFTQGLEAMQIVAAYTLKANGTRIDVPANGYLSGFGQSSEPGFQDEHIVSVFFPNLEVGDSVVLVTLRRQLVPLFASHFDFRQIFSRTVAQHDVRYSLTAPPSLPISVDASGLQGGDATIEDGKKQWVWTYESDTPVTIESDAVDESDFAPHLIVTTFADYGEVAKAYVDRSKAATAVTPEIQALADKLTQGATDKREKARILYDWVSANIAYVAIELGAGGFTPHAAKDVLANRFGDCKDHVTLLESLLKAEGIESEGALIDAGSKSYKLPAAASPLAFDHIITYLPQFNLYLDSTAQYAPFGVLPYEDAGKPVLRVEDGQLARAPVPTSETSRIHAVSEVTIGADGSVKGHGTLTASGALGVDMRRLMQFIPVGKENDLFRNMMGPGAEGTLDRGDPLKLEEPYVASATYSMPNAVTFPGPGALPFSLGFKPFYFTELVAGNLPAKRNSNYVCLSLSAQEDTTIKIPEGVKLIAIPDHAVLKADGILLTTDYDRSSPQVLHETVVLKLDHPEEFCTPEYYASVHDAIQKMANLLHRQIIYRGPSEEQ